MRPKTNVSHGSRANMAYWIVEALHYCMTPLFFDLVCNSVELPLLSTPPLPLPAVSAFCFYVLEFVSLPLRNRLRTNSKLFGKIQTHTHIHTTEVWKKNNYNKREIKWEEIFVFAAVTQQHKHTRDIQQTTQIQQNPNQKSSHFNNSPTPRHIRRAAFRSVSHFCVFLHKYTVDIQCRYRSPTSSIHFYIAGRYRDEWMLINLIGLFSWTLRFFFCRGFMSIVNAVALTPTRFWALVIVGGEISGGPGVCFVCAVDFDEYFCCMTFPKNHCKRCYFVVFFSFLVCHSMFGAGQQRKSAVGENSHVQWTLKTKINVFHVLEHKSKWQYFFFYTVGKSPNFLVAMEYAFQHHSPQQHAILSINIYEDVYSTHRVYTVQCTV